MQQNTTNPQPASTDLDGAMRTGQGADDEPDMTIADKHTGDTPLPDPNGDGTLTLDEAAALLGDDQAAATVAAEGE